LRLFYLRSSLIVRILEMSARGFVSRPARRIVPQLFVCCLCSLQGARGLRLENSPRSGDDGSFNVYCRAFDERGLPTECPVSEVQSSPNITSQRRLAAPSPLEMLSQECLNDVAIGNWTRSDSYFYLDSLGARKRYAGPMFYFGPPRLLEEETRKRKEKGSAAGSLWRLMLETPHSRQWGYPHITNDVDTDIIWRPDARTSGCPKYEWFQQDDAKSCLTNTWVAFWGDSTTRMLFSALVDFLGDGIEDPTFPTHDFTYHYHAHDVDQCTEGDCHFLVHFPKRNIVLTFKFVVQSMRSKNGYPHIWEKLEEQRRNFTGIPFPKAEPDVIIMNNGPWEYYSYMNTTWMGDLLYKKRFKEWLVKKYGRAEEQRAEPLPKLIVMKNTACTQAEGNCEASNVSCVDAMDNVDRLQREVIGNLTDSLKTSIRYLDGMYSRLLPTGYHCDGETSYHLPAVVTDQRLNHALHAICPTHGLSEASMAAGGSEASSRGGHDTPSIRGFEKHVETSSSKDKPSKSLIS